MPLWVDCSLALLLFVSAAFWGTTSWKRAVTGGQPFYYQHYFEPAVMIACGKGFVVAQPQVPAMVPFLWRQVDRFSCDAIPSTASLGTEGLYQGPWRYLMLAVGSAWRLLGVSWSGLGPLFGTLFGATIAVIYAIFRLGMSPVLAVVGAVALSLSKLHLAYLPSLRDYAKAPFTLLLVVLLGLLVKRRTNWKTVIAIAAAYGAVVGVGYGFRTDFLADIPLFFLTLIIFLDGGPFRHIRLKAAATAVFAAAFLVTSWPIVSSVYRSGGCQWHTVLLGLSKDFFRPLDVDEPPYQLSRQYLDEFVYATVTSYAARVQPGVGHIEYCEPQYDAVTGRYLKDLVTRFPADMVLRAYASTLRIVELPFTWRNPPPPTEDREDQPLDPERGHGIGLGFVIAAIGLAAASSPRIGLFLLFCLLYFGGYPSIQFNARHYFHLEFITWWAAGFLLQFVFSDLWRMVRDEPRTIASSVRRAVVVVGGSAVGLVLVLWVTRAYQQVAARALMQSYVAAPKEEIRLSEALSGTFLPVTRPSPRTDPETADFLEVDLNGWRCGEQPVVTFRYDASTRKDFSRAFTVRHTDDFREPTRIFMPVYDGFQGINFSDTRPGCVGGVYRVRYPERISISLMLEVALPPRWQSLPLYQRLRGAGLGD